MTRAIDRRDLLKTWATAGVGFWVGGGAAADDSKSPNERVQFACIGVDGKGESDTADADRHGVVAALCDIDEQRLAKAAKRYPKAKTFVDSRKMFDTFGKSIDA